MLDAFALPIALSIGHQPKNFVTYVVRLIKGCVKLCPQIQDECPVSSFLQFSSIDLTLHRKLLHKRL
jgi:hypothetical protein